MYVCMYVCLYALGQSWVAVFVRIGVSSWSSSSHFVERSWVFGARSRCREGEAVVKKKKLGTQGKEEVGKRELCLLEQEEEEEEQLTEVQHSSVCLLERSTQQQTTKGTWLCGFGVYIIVVPQQPQQQQHSILDSLLFLWLLEFSSVVVSVLEILFFLPSSLMWLQIVVYW